jgi:DNA primase
VSEGRLAGLFGGGMVGVNGGGTTAAAADRSSHHSAPIERSLDDAGARFERTFLAMCLAVPDAGERALATIDPDEWLTSGVMRRVARHLSKPGNTRTPLVDLPPDDDELADVVADLINRAARGGSISSREVEHSLLLLERSHLDRQIIRARAERIRDIPALAARRQQIRDDILLLGAKLEKPV